MQLLLSIEYFHYNRMAKGCKEIDIAATLEHIRDQRGGMVQTR